MTPITLTAALAEARRELALRQNVYPKWVQAGKLNPTVSDHRIACSKFIVERLEMLQMLDEAGEQMRLTLQPREKASKSDIYRDDSLDKQPI